MDNGKLFDPIQIILLILYWSFMKMDLLKFPMKVLFYNLLCLILILSFHLPLILHNLHFRELIKVALISLNVQQILRIGEKY